MPSTILVIDDTLSVRMTLQYMLERRGYEVVLAENGFAGLEAARDPRISGVLLDFHMPGMNGLDVCRTLTAMARESLRTLPVWMMTGGSTAQLVKDARAAGAETLLSKPFDLEAFYQLVDSRLGNRAGGE